MTTPHCMTSRGRTATLDRHSHVDVPLEPDAQYGATGCSTSLPLVPQDYRRARAATDRGAALAAKQAADCGARTGADADLGRVRTLGALGGLRVRRVDVVAIVPSCCRDAGEVQRDAGPALDLPRAFHRRDRSPHGTASGWYLGASDRHGPARVAWTGSSGLFAPELIAVVSFSESVVPGDTVYSRNLAAGGRSAGLASSMSLRSTIRHSESTSWSGRSSPARSCRRGW